MTEITNQAQVNALNQEKSNIVYFEKLYKQYYSNIYTYSLQQTDSKEAAQDATICFFVKLAQKTIGIEQPKQFVERFFNNISTASHHTDNSLKASPTTF